MNSLPHPLLAVTAAVLLSVAHPLPATPASSRFQPAWDSLAQFECPEWFRDAKFGIYAHWGPYAVPEAPLGGTDWYARNLYRTDHPAHAFHTEKYGPVAKAGYKDLVPLFTAAKFDADAWAELFAASGARFAGPVAEHADGFAMFATKVSPWNAAEMGPRRDIVAELERAIRHRGLKFMVSFHHSWNYGWYPTWDPASGCADPALAGLYGPPVPKETWEAIHYKDVVPLPDTTFCANWLGKINTVVDRHAPDLLWFDSRLSIIAESFRLTMAAHYYNTMDATQRPGLITYKNQDLRADTGVLDLERSRMTAIHSAPWLTDTSVAKNTWGYSTKAEYYSTDRLVDDLVDIVSKNGCLLLNVAPHPDGTIPAEQQQILRGIGAWLRLNGEAIYATRPWTTFGEGSTVVVEGRFSDLKLAGFTAEDVRFTRSKDGRTLYAILLGWPAQSAVSIRALAAGADLPPIDTITLLGHPDPIPWTRDAAGLHVSLPATAPGQYAFTLKLALRP